MHFATTGKKSLSFSIQILGIDYTLFLCLYVAGLLGGDCHLSGYKTLSKLYICDAEVSVSPE